MVDRLSSPDYERSRSVLGAALRLADLGNVGDTLHWLGVADDLGKKCGLPLGDAIIAHVQRRVYHESVKRSLSDARYFSSRGDVLFTGLAVGIARESAAHLGSDISERVQAYTLQLVAEANSAGHSKPVNLEFE